MSIETRHVVTGCLVSLALCCSDSVSADDLPKPIVKLSVSGLPPEEMRLFALDAAKTHDVDAKAIGALFRWLPKSDDSLATFRRRIFPREWGTVLVRPKGARRLTAINYMQLLKDENPTKFLPDHKTTEDRRGGEVFESTEVFETKVPVIDDGNVSFRKIPHASVSQFYCIRNGALWHANSNVFAKTTLPELKFPTDEVPRFKLELDSSHIADDVRNAWNAVLTRGLQSKLQAVDNESPTAAAARKARIARTGFPVWAIQTFIKGSLSIDAPGPARANVSVSLSGDSDWGDAIRCAGIISRHREVDEMSTISVSVGFPEWKPIEGLHAEHLHSLTDVLTYMANRDRKIDVCLHVASGDPQSFGVLAISTTNPEADAEAFARVLRSMNNANTMALPTTGAVWLLINAQPDHPRVTRLRDDYAGRRPKKAPLIGARLKGGDLIAGIELFTDLLMPQSRGFLPSRTQLQALGKRLRASDEQTDRLVFRLSASGDRLIGRGEITKRFTQSAVSLIGAIYQEKARRFQKQSEERMRILRDR